MRLTSKRKRCFNVKSPKFHFHEKTKILPDFQIYISVPLKCYIQINAIKTIQLITEYIPES